MLVFCKEFQQKKNPHYPGNRDEEEMQPCILSYICVLFYVCRWIIV